MKILFLEGDMSRGGGTERMTALISGYLSGKYTVSIISLGMKKPEVFYQLNSGVEHSVLKNGNMLQKILEIHKYIAKNNIDVVVNVDIGMGIYGVLASSFTTAKVITWEHANFFNNWNSKIFPYLRKFAAKRSDALVVLTELDKKNYINGIKHTAPITVIPNPIMSNITTFDINSKTILSAGLFCEIKRFNLIPKMAEIIFSKHPDWQWVICGDGPEYENIKNLICEYKLENNILLAGKVNNIEEYYKNAAMYVLTSRTEGLPMVLLEAKSYGLPLVSFDIMTGPSDVIRDGENGYLVKDYDIDEMTSKILYLIENNDIRQSFSDNSQLDIEKFSENTVVKKWETLIQSL